MRSTAEWVSHLREVRDHECADRLESLDRQCRELLEAVIAEEQAHFKTLQEMYNRGEVIDQVKAENTELRCVIDKLKLDQRDSAEALTNLHTECRRLDEENEKLKHLAIVGVPVVW